MQTFEDFVRISAEKLREITFLRLSLPFWNIKRQGDIKIVDIESTKSEISLGKKIINLKSYQEALKIQIDLKDWLKSRCSESFLDDGIFCVRKTQVEEFREKILAERKNLQDAVSKMLEELPLAVSRARQDLKWQFCLKNYPGVKQSPEEISVEDLDKFKEIYPDWEKWEAEQQLPPRSRDNATLGGWIKWNEENSGTFYLGKMTKFVVEDKSLIASKFSIKWRFFEFEIPKDLPAEVLKEEKAKLKEEMEQAALEIVQALREAFSMLIKKAVERFTPDADGNAKQFKASTLEKISEFISLFDGKNIFGDQDLQKLVLEAKEVLKISDPDIIRENMEIRNFVSEQFKKVDQELDNLVEMKINRRKICFD